MKIAGEREEWREREGEGMTHFQNLSMSYIEYVESLKIPKS